MRDLLWLLLPLFLVVMVAWFLLLVTRTSERAPRLPLYPSNDEIVEDMVRRIRAGDPVNLHMWQLAAKEDLFALHHGTGRNIRNTYNMWDENNLHSVLDDPMHEMHPDQRSHAVIEKVWERLQEGSGRMR